MRPTAVKAIEGSALPRIRTGAEAVDGGAPSEASVSLYPDRGGSCFAGGIFLPRVPDPIADVRPVLGKIAPISLSGGVKTLILMKNEQSKIFNASTCGDDCAKWILKLAETDDLTINLRHLMDFGEGAFDIRILNTDKIVHSMRELVPVAGLYV